MIWIILALTLGASITSIIHGVFMLFGSLSITGAAIPGIPSTMLSVLPIISAIFALIGGILAFNQNKWGALFLFIAMGLCAPARDTWLYGGLYFFAGLLCFFLSKKPNDGYSDLYDDYGGSESSDYPSQSDGQDFYYMEDVQPSPELSPEPNIRMIDEDVSVVAPQPNNEPPKLRRRMSKSCPECGAVVSRDAFYCPTCGAKLFVVSDEADNSMPSKVTVSHDPLDDTDIESVNNQLFSPAGEYNMTEQGSEESDDSNMNDGDEEMSSAQAIPNYRVTVKPRRAEPSYPAASAPRRSTRSSVSAEEAASSYTEFSKYANKGKKRRRSAGRKILSMLLIVSAVGGALYFLLGLRKLPPGELPPMVRPEVLPAPSANDRPGQPSPQPPSGPGDIAEPAAVAVAENELPDFTPERTPQNGAIIGSNVNVRADHTTNSSRVTRLSVGSRVEVLGTFNVPSGQYSGIWYNIRTGGREGWVYGRYVQPLGSGIPAGYSNALMKSFGSSRSQLIESLGKPTRSTSSSAEWSGLTATLRGEDITRIRVTGASRELQNGLKPGMSQTALQNIMGYPSSVNGKTLNYNEGGKTGISVQLDKNNAISTITVSEVQ
ncbi:MAG: SH3 domain-containing protein [Synergistaceae bacterium]|nr:SH3 domain-containing protein [Synergistaceae bacterium]